MAHTSYGELRQLFEIFARVWGSGGQASLHLHSQDSKSRATLNIELGPPADPTLELQLSMRRGLDSAIAPSNTLNHASSAPAAVDLQLVLETRPGEHPSFRRSSSRLMLNLPAVI